MKNAGRQTLAAVRYDQVVSRKTDGQVFHNEPGYWMWDADIGTVMHSLTIPRGVCVLAGGAASPTSTVLEVQASADDDDWGIVQSPFMQDIARTTRFEHRVMLIRRRACVFRDNDGGDLRQDG